MRWFINSSAYFSFDFFNELCFTCIQLICPVTSVWFVTSVTSSSDDFFGDRQESSVAHVVSIGTEMAAALNEYEHCFHELVGWKPLFLFFLPSFFLPFFLSFFPFSFFRSSFIYIFVYSHFSFLISFMCYLIYSYYDPIQVELHFLSHHKVWVLLKCQATRPSTKDKSGLNWGEALVTAYSYEFSGRSRFQQLLSVDLLVAAQRAKQQFIFLRQEKSRIAWLRPFAIRPLTMPRVLATIMLSTRSARGLSPKPRRSLLFVILYSFWKWYSWEAYQKYWVHKRSNHYLLIC